MKNFFFAVIFLFSQIGFSAERADLINSKGYHIENEKFSSLILSKEELSHLSDKDKTEYLFSIIALSQILESAQSDVMGYDDSDIHKSTSLNDSKILQLLEASVLKSKAWGPVVVFALEAIGSLAVWEGVKGVAKFVASKAAARAVASAAEKKGVDGVAKVAASGLLKKGSKAALEAGEELVKKASQKMNVADAALKANKDPKKRMSLLKEAMESERDLDLAKNAFVKGYGGDPKKLDKLVNGSLIGRYVTWPNIAKLAAAGFIFKGADTILKEAVGVGLTDFAVGSSEAAAAELKAGDSKQEKGKSCIFGGHPSVWKDFGEVGIKCTRPAESRSESCKGDNQFLCADYGITLAEGSIQTELCLDKAPLDNLTVRCTTKLHSVLTNKKATVKTDEMLKHQKEIKEIIARIEANPSMKDEEGKTKSIFQYCEAKPVAQKEECNAIQGVLAALKQTGVPKVLAARPVAPPAAAAGAPEAAAAPAKQ